MTQAKDLVGQQFGLWTVLARAGSWKSNALWEVKCGCGSIRRVVTNSLTSGGSKSCGCQKRELVRVAKTSHGKRNTRIYLVWASMIQRTTNPKHKQWEDYGGRGIGVSESWKTFENFFKDMGEAPVGLQLERRENSLGYNKENCEWATRVKNNRNKRSNIFVEYSGKQVTITEASELSGINKGTLSSRYHKGLRGSLLFKPVC